jgi:hypothetical protein
MVMVRREHREEMAQFDCDILIHSFSVDEEIHF